MMPSGDPDSILVKEATLVLDIAEVATPGQVAASGTATSTPTRPASASMHILATVKVATTTRILTRQAATTLSTGMPILKSASSGQRRIKPRPAIATCLGQVLLCGKELRCEVVLFKSGEREGAQA